MAIVDYFRLTFIKYVFHLKRSNMGSLVYGETGRDSLSMSVYERTVRFGQVWSNLIFRHLLPLWLCVVYMRVASFGLLD